MLRRSIGTAVAVLTVCAILLGAGPSTFTPYENEKYGYRLDIPAGFVMQGDWGMQTSWIYIPGEKEDFEGAVFPIISVISYEIPKRFSAESLYNAKMKKIRELIDEKDSGYDDLETLKIEGGYALMYKDVNTDDDQALNHWYVKIYGSGREYTIDISGTRRQLRERRSEFRHVVESFGFIP
jgi:hypothetical protein